MILIQVTYALINMRFVEQKQEHVSKLNGSMVKGTSLSVLPDVLQTGADLVGVFVPGIPLVLKALGAIYTIASSYANNTDETARLMSYCAAVATALTRFKVRDTPELRTALDAAAEALEELRAMIAAHMGQGNLALMFKSAPFKSASERVKRDVEAAVRRAMDEAQFLLMEDVANSREDLAKTKSDVALLMARRYARARRWAGPSAVCSLLLRVRRAAPRSARSSLLVSLL